MSKLEKNPPLGGAISAMGFSNERLAMYFEPFLGVAKLTVKDCALARLPEIERALGAAPPDEPNTVVRGDGVDIAWTAPNQWLLLGEEDHVEGKRAAVEKILAGKTALVTSLTHARAAFHLAKAGARDILASLCPLDLHPRSFGPQCCAVSLLGDAAVFIQQYHGLPAFRVIVDQSYAAYAWRLLSGAAETYAANGE